MATDRPGMRAETPCPWPHPGPLTRRRARAKIPTNEPTLDEIQRTMTGPSVISGQPARLGRMSAAILLWPDVETEGQGQGYPTTRAAARSAASLCGCKKQREPVSWRSGTPDPGRTVERELGSQRTNKPSSASEEPDERTNRSASEAPNERTHANAPKYLDPTPFSVSSSK
jgi:hypothetical protein